MNLTDYKNSVLREILTSPVMRLSVLVDQYGRPIYRPVPKIGKTIYVRKPERFGHD